MSHVDDRQERAEALKEFAEIPLKEGNKEVATAQIFGQPLGERMFGAQRVAVYRDEERILQKLKKLGAAAGDDWYYRWQVSNADGTKSWVEGPSIKLANDLARLYGNCEIEVRVMDLGSHWIFYARFIDYESGYALTRAFRQRAKQNVGKKMDPDRAMDIVFQIGQSKAIRNVTVNALQTFADYAFTEAKASIVERIGRNIESYRERVLKSFAGVNLDIKRVELLVGRTSKEWLAPDIAQILAVMKSVSDGMATMDESFPPLGGAPETKGDGKPDPSVWQEPDEKQNGGNGGTKSKTEKTFDNLAAGAAGAKDAAGNAVEHDPETGEVTDKEQAKTPAADEAGEAADETPGDSEHAKSSGRPAELRPKGGDAAPSPQVAAASGQAGIEDPDARHARVIKDLSDAAAIGTSKLRLAIGKLSAPDHEVITDADEKALFKQAGDADKRKR